MLISNYYMALNMLNDLSWIVVAAGDNEVSREALTEIDRLRHVLLMAIQTRDPIKPPLKDLLDGITDAERKVLEKLGEEES